MVKSKYISEIPKEILTSIKTKNKKKIFCEIHTNKRLTKYYNQRVCRICNKESRSKSAKKQMKKKEIEKNAKFQFYGVIKN
jgi:hypothetical protein